MSSLHDPALTWRKSRRSSGGGNECVEVAALAVLGTEGTAVRDSKNPAGPALSFSPREWAAFSARVKAGALDL